MYLSFPAEESRCNFVMARLNNNTRAQPFIPRDTATACYAIAPYGFKTRTLTQQAVSEQAESGIPQVERLLYFLSSVTSLHVDDVRWYMQQEGPLNKAYPKRFGQNSLAHYAFIYRHGLIADLSGNYACHFSPSVYLLSRAAIDNDSGDREYAELLDRISNIQLP